MNRRQFLTAATSAAAAALAGCTAPSNDDGTDDPGDDPENDSPETPGGDPRLEQLHLVEEPSSSPDEVFDPGSDEEYKDWENKPPTVRYYENERILAVEGQMTGGGCSSGLQKERVASDSKALIALSVMTSKPEDPDEPVACPAVIRTYPYSFAVGLPDRVDTVEIRTTKPLVLSLPGLDPTATER